MKRSLTFLAAVLISAVPATSLADSADTAAAFAAATPTSYEGTITFLAVSQTGSRPYVYEFTLNSAFKVTALVVNGTWVNIPPEAPLGALPYPQTGTMQNVTVSIEAWDDYSSPLPSEVTGLPPSSPDDGRYAGSGYSARDLVGRDDLIWVILNPAELVAFMPVDAVDGNVGLWSLTVYGGSASGATWHDGHWGFWVRVNPRQSFYWYSLNGPEGSGWGVIDPADVPGSYANGSSVAITPTDGVQIADLRAKEWVAQSGFIDGHIDEKGSPGSLTEWPSHRADGIALRAWSWQTIQVSYAGPAAWLLVQELDEYGQVVHRPDGSASEWAFFSGPGQSYESSALQGSFSLPSGRARVIVTPADNTSRGNPYLVAFVGQGGKG